MLGKHLKSGGSCFPPRLLQLFISYRTIVCYVDIAIGYELAGREVWIRVLVGARFFLLHVVQTGFGAHPASYPMDTGGFSSGGKSAGAWSLPLISN
jgi:hypothetical protein